MSVNVTTKDVGPTVRVRVERSVSLGDQRVDSAIEIEVDADFADQVDEMIDLLRGRLDAEFSKSSPFNPAPEPATS